MFIKILTLLICLTPSAELSCERIAEELRLRMDSSRLWEPSTATASWLSKHFGGTTAIVTLALAEHGEDIEHAATQLWGIPSPHLYVRSLRLLIWNTNIEKYRERARRDAKSLGKRNPFAQLVQQQIIRDGKVQLQQHNANILSPQKRGWSLKHQPQIEKVLFAELGKGRIFFAHFDIRHAFMQTTSWQIHGYNHQTTKELLDTILMVHESS